MSDLMKLSLNKPVRVSIDNMKQTAKTLVQEFVRIRQSHGQDRDAVLLGNLESFFSSNIL